MKPGEITCFRNIMRMRLLLFFSLLLFLVDIIRGEAVPGAEALNALTIRCGKPEVQRGLTDLGNNDIERLLLEFKNPEVRRSCFDVLHAALRDVSSPIAAGPLLKALEDPALPGKVRYSILIALGRIGDPAALDVVRRESGAKILKLPGAKALFSLMKADEGSPVEFDEIKASVVSRN